MEDVELPNPGEIVRINSPYSEFHGAVGFVSDYIETPGNLSILAVCVHISGREDIIVEVECLKWRKRRVVRS